MTDTAQAGERRSPGSSPLAASPPVKQPATPGIWPGGEANQIQLIRVDHLHASALNPRKHFAAEPLAELAASICAQGLLQNLVARPHPKLPGAYELAAGERRWRAAKLAVADGRLGADYALPVAVRALDDASMTATGLAENAARHDLTALEEARAYGALAAAGADTAHIARLAGRSQRHVQLRLDLLKRLAPPALQALEAGAITAEQARVLCRAPKARQKDLVDELIPDADGRAGFITARQLLDAVRQVMIPLANAIFPRERYTGAVVDDDKGQACADDVGQFRRLQQAAVAARKAELAKKWPWVEIKDEHWDSDLDRINWPLQRAPKAKDAGALILLGRRSLRVVVHEGIVDFERRRKAAAKAAKNAPAGKAAPGEYFEPWGLNQAVAAIRLVAIRDRVAGDHALAQRLVILLALAPFEITLDPASGPLPTLLAKLQPKDKTGLGTAWLAIGKLDPGRLAAHLTAAVAAMIAFHDDGADLATLGAVIGAAVAPAALDKKFLDLCGPDQRAAMAKELGVELKALKPAAARAALLAAARKRKDYVPSFLRFPARPNAGQSTLSDAPGSEAKSRGGKRNEKRPTKRAKGKA